MEVKNELADISSINLDLRRQLDATIASKDNLQSEYDEILSEQANLRRELVNVQMILQHKLNEDNKNNVLNNKAVLKNNADLLASSRIEELQKTSDQLRELKTIADTENIELKLEITHLKNELTRYQNQLEILKTRLNEFKSKENTFMDTFEEVMKDEMMSMKSAFEAKLRLAKEKSDAMALRHHQELNRIREEKYISLISKSPPPLLSINRSTDQSLLSSDIIANDNQVSHSLSHHLRSNSVSDIVSSRRLI